jgi:P4 family phage/plasmid primase-like protien
MTWSRRAALRQWFGYVISGRLDLHKILLLVGPTRAGKGATARILGALVGDENVAGPTLSSLNGDFGLAPLLGKTLAVVSDARLNGRNASVVVERLLSISGEDTLTANRKYREQWTGKLPTRLMLCSNELPQLGDASMAIAGRFVPLFLTRSWLGQEDFQLEQALREELPGILNWSLDGLEQLAAQGRFTRPPGADEAIVALQDLASPVAAFVRDRCVRGPEHEVPVDELYAAWKTWADDNGHVKLTKQVFGRDLRAAVPGLRWRGRATGKHGSASTRASASGTVSRGDITLRWTADHADQEDSGPQCGLPGFRSTMRVVRVVRSNPQCMFHERGRGAVSATRPTAVELLERPGALLSRTHLRELGLTRRGVDAVFRELPIVVLPGYSRPLVRAEDYRALLERCTHDGTRVR